jgi:aspartate racemase
MKNLKNQVSLFVILALTFAFVPSCRAQVATDEQKTQTNLARDGVVSSIRSMTAKRAAHTATLLDNGKVLIAGGFVSNGGGLSSVELFDPTSNTFTLAENLTVARASHTATLLPNGKILIAGGYNGNYLNSAEVQNTKFGGFRFLNIALLESSEMKTLGIIGGIAPESTIEYYRLIITSYRIQIPDGSYPPLVINSINLKKMLDLIGANELAQVTEYLLSEVRRLARAGADFGLLAANTPHIVFEDIQRESPIPLISIVQSACEAARDLKLKRVGLFGTRFTMQGQFYPEVFSRYGITLVVPDLDEQDYIHDKYMSELVNGIFLPETREELLQIAERLKERMDIEGLILGGTELPLILRDVDDRGIPFLDTTKIHVKDAVAQMLS